jgi:hypothetical protein
VTASDGLPVPPEPTSSKIQPMQPAPEFATPPDAVPIPGVPRQVETDEGVEFEAGDEAPADEEESNG